MEQANGIVALVALVTVLLLVAGKAAAWCWRQLRKMMPPIWTEEEQDRSCNYRCPMCGTHFDEEGQVMP